MRRSTKFRPDALNTLEVRVTPSHAGTAEIGAAMSPPHGHITVNSHGSFTTELPAGIGGADHLTFTGTTRVPRIGPFRESGNLTSNPSLPPSPTNTQGTIVLTGVGKNKGTLTLAITGQGVDLAPRVPTTSQLHFKVTAATGQFSSAVGIEGEFDMTLVARGRSRNGTAHGRYTSTFNFDA